MTRPSIGYRPPPRDFEQQFVEHGHEAIQVYGYFRPMFYRWCEELGYDRLKALRREYVEAKYAAEGKRVGGRRPRSAAGRYVMGMRRKIEWPCDQPRFEDFGLLETGK
jgi:hypothetical protein